MYAAIIGGVIEILLKGIGIWLDKSKADAATKQKFLEFVDAVSVHRGAMVRLSDSYQGQLERLKKIREEQAAQKKK